MPTPAQILEAGGLVNVDALIAAAEAVGVPLWVAAAVMEKETHGRNVYGNDAGGTFATPGAPDLEVTETNYAEFYELVVVQKQRSNGVGPFQITYPGYFPQAKEQGLRLWEPVDNITFGLRLIARNLNGDHGTESIERAGTLYNAGNLTNGITAYGRDLAAKAALWLARLTLIPATERLEDADATLRFPDFRAEERTFALVAQLAGRAGRGAQGGSVLVAKDRCTPDHGGRVGAAGIGEQLA